MTTPNAYEEKQERKKDRLLERPRRQGRCGSVEPN